MPDQIKDADIELILRCREVEDIAKKVQDRSMALLQSVGAAESVYTFRHRIKPATSIFSKVSRKRDEGVKDEAANGPSERAKKNKDYGPDHITDAFACRYVTLYQSEIPVVLKQLLTALVNHNQASPGRPIEATEFVIYTNRPKEDPLSIVAETTEVARASGLVHEPDIRQPESRKSAYSSVHLVLKASVDVSFPGRSSTREDARFEVQVRDIFEEGWGEIQHNLIYSGKDQQLGSEENEPMDSLWQPHLNALKTFVDGCSQHASIIKDSYEYIRRRSIASLENKSTSSQRDDRDAILAILQMKGAAPEVLDDIRIGYQLVIDAQETDGGEKEESASYRAAALKFGDAIERLGPLVETRVSALNDASVGFHLRIERANALVFSGDREALKQAISIYEGIEKEFPNDPISRLRLSGALMVQLRQTGLMRSADPSAAPMLTRALELTRAASSLAAADRSVGPDHWLNISARVREGFILFSLSKLEEQGSEKRRELLREATDTTLAGYRLWETLREQTKEQETYRMYAHKALSNVLFYLADLIEEGETDAEYGRGSVRNNLELIARIEVPQYKEFYKTRDNLMKAHASIGNEEEANKLARANIAEFRKRAVPVAGRQVSTFDVEKYLNSEEAINYRNAVEQVARSQS